MIVYADFIKVILPIKTHGSRKSMSRRDDTREVSESMELYAKQGFVSSNFPLLVSFR